MKTKIQLEELLKYNRLQVCPIVLEGLIRALNDPNTTTSELARFLSADQSLTVRVLRMANSAFYSLPRPVKSVQEAAFRLGFREVWAMATSIQLSEVFKNAHKDWNPNLDSLWHHSLKVGILAKLIATHLGSKNGEELFTAGILHDLGKVVFMNFDQPAYLELTDHGRLRGKALIRAEIDGFGIDHASLGGQLLKAWNLPQALVQMVECHHAEADSELLSPVTVLTAADALAYAVRIDSVDGCSTGLTRLDATDEDLRPCVTDRLPLDPSACVVIGADGMRVFGDLVHAFE